MILKKKKKKKEEEKRSDVPIVLFYVFHVNQINAV